MSISLEVPLLVANLGFISLKVNVNRDDFLIRYSVAEEHPKLRITE